MTGPASLTARCCGLAVLVIGLAGLMPLLVNLPEQLDRLLVMHRMAAGAFVLGGSALLALHSGHPRAGTALVMLMLTLAAINFFALDTNVHAWLEAGPGLRLTEDLQMAPMTSALFLATGSTLLLCRWRGEAATIPAAIVLVLCLGVISGQIVRFTIAGDYWPVLASVTPHSGTAHALLALGSLMGVVARQPLLWQHRQRRLVTGSMMLLTAMTVIAVGSVSWRDYQATVGDVEAETRNLARLLEEHAHRRIEPVRMLMRQLLQTTATDFPQADNTLAPVFLDAAATLPQIQALMLLPADGAPVRISGFAPTAATLAELRALLDARAASDAGAHLAVVRNLPRPGFMIAESLASGDHRTTALALFDARYFSDFYASLELGGDGSSGLFRRDGLPLVLHPQPALADPLPVQASIFTHPGATTASFIDRSHDAGPERFVAYRHSHILPLTVVTSVALTPAILHFEGRLRTTLLLMLAALAALGTAAHLQLQAIRRQETAERALVRSRDFADAVLNSMDSHIAILDPQGEIIATNRAWRELRRLSGCMDAERSRLHQCEVCHKSLADAALAERVRRGMAAVRAGQRHTFVLTYPCSVAHTARWFNLRITPFAGRPGHVVVSHDDVTELKLAEQALAVAKQEAESANQAKTRFLANTSHELRTPLTAVLGLTRLLGQTTLDQQQRGQLERIETASRALLASINDILDLSKIEAGKIEIEHHPFDLRRMLEEVVALFDGVAAEKGLQLCLECPDDLPAAVSGDAVRLQQVLINLIGNALKFTKRGGVTVQVTTPHGREHASVRLRFAVRDTGVGMQPDQVSRLFQAFVQGDNSTTRRYGGTGLGLAISGRLVNLMGGQLEVDSRPEHGSNFHFTLALALADRLPPTATTEEIRLDGLRVLVVEDNELNRSLAGEVLTLAGAEPILLADGRQAVDHLARAEHTVHAVLMDVQMPELDGMAATRAIRAMPHRQTLPIIAMTANALGSERTECLAAGMDDYLTKPLDIDGLLRSVKSRVSLPGATG